MTTDQIVEKLKTWINFKLMPNPSGQNQIFDHLYPHLAATLFLMTIPVIGIYISLIVPAFALYKELWEDRHYLDLWKSTESGKDGRCDLFFRLAGSLIAYATMVWQ